MPSTTRKFVGSVKDDWQLYSDRSTDYTIGSPIGFGASSVVYAAIYNPNPQRPIPCALKVLDLDALPPHSLSLLQRETQLMSLSKHPNVLRVRGSWMDGHKLYIALRLMNKGSAADVMHYGWPGGMEEEVVKCILKQALEGLNYLHINGFIHRDVKGANLLIDDDGTVLLGDLGVAASLTDDADISSRVCNDAGSHSVNFGPVSTATSSCPVLVRPGMGKRKSFVGTPCWMAPELIQGHRYDSKADIWSFAITAIELTQGRPPRSRESAHNVLLQTVQGKPPKLDLVGGVHRYSRAFKDMVDACLVKDPSKRPTAAQLLHTSFFRSSKKKSYLVSTILDDLPPLTMRQERRKHPSMITHGTMDSWDFNSTETNPSAPSIHLGSKRGSSGGVPRSGSLDVGSDNHHELVDVHPRFELTHGAEEETASITPVVVSSASFSTSINVQGLDIEKDKDEFLLSGSQLRTNYGVSQSLDSSFPGPRSVPAPIPIPKRASSYFRKGAASAPTSAPPLVSPKLWQRLTHATSRNIIDEYPPVREKKMSGLSRMLSRRGTATSLAQ
ncbi:kinase-like protein [Suillus clintonianus]|uniref:kinase-like protein n=1 Tax=Suillus clintonianus TaxID=1904413 RepID=UPI001B8633C9|nr:kinase-like protein [Suillus clintonianus]KAG2155432.1 kinase-like protein [Suillus clintonianus]